MMVNQLKYEMDCIEHFYDSLIKEGLIEPCKKENHPQNCWINAQLEIYDKLLELKKIKDNEK